MSLREARIDLSAIGANVGTIRAALGGHPAMVVVKANGYGHGAIETARAALAGGATWLGVADLTEALELRASGIDAPILCWIHDPEADFSLAVDHDIDIAVNSLDQLERAAIGATVQLKVDTGLNRNGFGEADWPSAVERAAELELQGRVRVRGIFSHLANAGAESDRQQLSRFNHAVDAARVAGLDPALVHLASTAGAITLPEARFDLVRIGIGAYGISPFERGEQVPFRLIPAMELSAAVIAVKRVPAGSGVSYGFSYVTERETTLALVPLGYADGIPRHASNRGPVSINGTRYTVSGRIAMDQFVVDVGDDSVHVGDRAVLFGNPGDGVPSADDWAAAADTIPYEIVTRIGPRVVRRYLP